MDRILARERLSARETAFWLLVEASHVHTSGVRKQRVLASRQTLSAEEIYHANAVIALFNFYNKFVDVNGVDELTPEGYEASGVRLSTTGYGPPAQKQGMKQQGAPATAKA